MEYRSSIPFIVNALQESTNPFKELNERLNMVVNITGALGLGVLASAALLYARNMRKRMKNAQTKKAARQEMKRKMEELTRKKRDALRRAYVENLATLKGEDREVVVAIIEIIDEVNSGEE